MTTSAKSLYDFLSKISNYDDEILLSDACSDFLFEDIQEDSVGRAVDTVRNLSATLESDLSIAFENDADMLQHVRALFTHYVRFTKFAVYDQQIGPLSNQNQPLDVGKLKDLKTLDAILTGICERPTVTKTEELLKELNELTKGIKSLNLPDNIQTVLLKRIMQVHNIIANFEVFGTVNLTESLESLCGSLTMYLDEQKKKSTKGRQIIKNTLSFVAAVATAIILTDKTIDSGVDLIEHIPKVTALIEDYSKELEEE